MAQIAASRRINGLSPTARIPLEILTKIFQIACQLHWQVVDNGFRQDVTPLFIGSICGLWRDVAWSTPLLWDTVLVHISRKHHGTQAQLLGDWLLRAKSAPLDIRLFAKDSIVDEYILCAFQAIMRILVTRSDYWFYFGSPLLPQCHHIFENINFPMLRSICFQHPKSTFSTSDTPPVMSLIAPKLLHAYLARYNSLVVLPWEQLIQFETRSLTITECLNVLRQSPNLKGCRFGHVHPRVSISETIMRHSQLKLLHVILAKAKSMLLFDSITLPSLSELYIRHTKVGQRVLFSSIKSLILRSACDLKRFTIECLFDCADLIPCLEAIPSLIFFHLLMPDVPLALADMGLTRHFVTSLDPSNNSSRLFLPNLNNFVYRGPVLCDCRTIVDMLAHRWHLSDGGTSQSSIKVSKLMLGKVLFTPPYHVTADVLEELRNLREEGMAVDIVKLRMQL